MVVFNSQSDRSARLATLNMSCAELVNEVNALIDEEFEFHETEKRLEHFTKLNGKYDAEVKNLESKQKALRDAYVGLTTKFRSNETEARKTATKLYRLLRKQYEKKEQENGDPVPDVREWEIPLQFAAPRAIEPKVSAERSRISISLTRNLFKLKNHYRVRAHRTIGRAQAQSTQLKKVLEEKKAKQLQRQLMKARIESNIANLQESIETMRVGLMEPSNHIWYDVHVTYAEDVRNMLVQIDESEGPIGRSLSNREVHTVPVLTTIRRMSGPDINDAPHLLTQPEYRRNRTNKHTGGRDIESIFNAPLSVRYSEETFLAAQPKSQFLPRSVFPDSSLPTRPMLPMEEVASYHYSLTRSVQTSRVRPRLSNLALSQLRGVPQTLTDGSMTSSDYGDGDNVSSRPALSEVSISALNSQVNIMTNTNAKMNATGKCSLLDENCATHLHSSHAPGTSPSPSAMQGIPKTPPFDDDADLEESVFHSMKNEVSPLRINRESQSYTVPVR